MSVKVIQVIITELETRGSGDDLKSPSRIIKQCWDMDGNLLFEKDPCSRVITIEEDKKLQEEEDDKPPF
jgi:hypothetical protein